MSLYSILQHAHSGLRWLVLATLITAIVVAFMKGRSAQGPGKTPLYALILAHIQLLLGLVLYFLSPYVKFGAETMKDAIYRFYTVEHITLMIIAIVLITLGYVRAKRRPDNRAKSSTIFTFYLLALVLILVAIPWPFRNLGAGWF